MSRGVFTVTPDKRKTTCTVEYHNMEEAWTVDFDYKEIKSGWVDITATHFDHVFQSGTRTKRKYPSHIFRELVKRSINRQNFIDYLIEYHIVTNTILSDKYPSTWLAKMYPNDIYEIIRRAIIFDIGTKKICVEAIKRTLI